MIQTINEKAWHFVDKSAWGEGEWEREPDKLQWTDPDTGLPCLIVRNRWNGMRDLRKKNSPANSLSLCGYVGVAEGHPYFEVSYHELDSIEVHGGLTFSDSCQEEDKEHGICHIPEPGQSDRVWWLGFDCAHCNDTSPSYSHYFTVREWETYKNIEYVRQEVKTLADQLRAIAP